MSTTKSQDEMIEEIEAAEADGDKDLILAHLSTACSRECGEDEDEDEKYAWTEVTEEALDAFYRMVKSSSDTIEESAALDQLNRMIAALTAYKEEEAIVEVALGCIVALSSKASKDDAAAAAATAGVDSSAVAVGTVLEAMKEFSGEATIQEQACLAIEGLALWKDEWKEIFSGSEGISDELRGAKEERITNERNKAYPVRAATALGIELELELDGP
eukprot:jgi/Psemu1/16517/gm1.16517_g